MYPERQLYSARDPGAVEELRRVRCPLEGLGRSPQSIVLSLTTGAREQEGGGVGKRGRGKERAMLYTYI